jgi:hypothetical protein
MDSRTRLLTNAVVAAVTGGAIGALAGVWSAYRVPAVHRRPPPVANAKTVAASSSAPPRMTTMEPTQPPREPQAAPTSPVSKPASIARAVAAPSPAAKVSDIGGAPDVLERARVLAERPDVMALVALRENLVRGATEHGKQDSPAIKAQIDALDRYLDQARMLRLKIDAAEFQQLAPESKPSKLPLARR